LAFSDLLTQLHHYSGYPEESVVVNQFLELLRHPRAYHRDHLPGHITGSAWIVNECRTKTLLIQHAKLKRWLQPGGHADGERDIPNVARREAEEETGLRKIKLLREDIFDLDIHLIPDRKDFPQHWHYDVRFLFEGDEKDELFINDESTGLDWFELPSLKELTENNNSIMRMVHKTNIL
jgi:8-oxo-dGTP pyrophosphatase MutT (NUDIX family)